MDLLQFTNLLREIDDLRIVTEPVDPHLEIAALSALAGKEQGPALLFAKPRGSRYPILTNAFASARRLALALNQASLDAFGDSAHALLQNPQALAAASLPLLAKPACQQVIHACDKAHFGLLPRMTFWPGDAGPCLSAAVVVTRHPETGQVNAGIYRMQIIDHTRATLGWHPGSGAAEHFAAARRRNLPLNVAIALGTPPAVTLTASFPLPRDLDEFAFAARFSRTPLALARCATMELLVPANSQIVLEGYADPAQSCREGPFANHAGRQTIPRQSPVFHLTAVTHADRPLFQAIATGPPPSESCWTAKAFEPVLRRQIMDLYEEVRDISLPLEGIFQNFCFVSLAPYCAQPLDLLAALLELPCLRRFRFLVAVDEAVDVRDSSNVLWRIGNCVDPERDTRILHGPLAPWHDSPAPGQGSKVLVDATLKNNHTLIPGHPDPAYELRIQNLWRTIQQEA